MKKLLVTMVSGVALLVGMAAPAAAATTGAQTFTFVYIGNGDTATVAGAGPIQGSGGSVVLTDDGQGNGIDKVTFKKGTFFVDHQDTSTTRSFNEKTCIARFSGTGTYTLSGDTGAYAGATGSGTYSYRGTFFGTRTATGCSDNGTVITVVKATGTTTLP
jgi:hypothetical protein